MRPDRDRAMMRGHPLWWGRPLSSRTTGCPADTPRPVPQINADRPVSAAVISPRRSNWAEVTSTVPHFSTKTSNCSKFAGNACDSTRLSRE